MKKSIFIVSLGLAFIFSTQSAFAQSQKVKKGKNEIAGEGKTTSRIKTKEQPAPIEKKKSKIDEAKSGPTTEGKSGNKSMENKTVKVNKESKVVTPAEEELQSKASATKEKKVKEVKEAVNTSDDKAVGRNEKGRTIYEGPRGGRYYLTATGHKVYVKNKKENE